MEGFGQGKFATDAGPALPVLPVSELEAEREQSRQLAVTIAKLSAQLDEKDALIQFYKDHLFDLCQDTRALVRTASPTVQAAFRRAWQALGLPDDAA